MAHRRRSWASTSLLISRLPHAEQVPATTNRGGEPDRPRPGGPRPERAAQPRLPALMSFFDGILGTNQVLLNVVIPLWLVQETDAPRVLLAWLFGTNTVLAVLLQVPALAGLEPVRRRAARRPDQRRLHGAVLLRRDGHPRHHRLDDDRAGLAGPRDRDRRRAVPVRRPLGLPLRAVRPRPARASTRASPTSAAPSARCGRRRSSPSSRWTGAPPAGWSSPAIVVVGGIGIHPSAQAAERYLAARTRQSVDQPA